MTTATAGEALTLLEQRGLVDGKVGRGTFVKAIPHTIIADSIRRYWTFKSCSYGDLFEFREALEPEIAVLAAKRSTPEDR